MANSDKDLYLQAQRRLVASLVYDGTSATRVFELVGPQDVEEPALELIITSIMNLARQDAEISVISIGRELEREGFLAQSGGISELNALRIEGEKYRLEAPTELYAKIVRESSAKNTLKNLLNDSTDTFKDDSGMSAVDAISSLQSELSNALYGLADDSTITNVSDYMENYFEVLEERLKVSIENEDKADGLQGIPSLIPTLNKYTSGWQPQQLITVGARTGVGKALALNTPIFTPDGWTTMKNIQVDDYVYGRDGKPTKVVNVTGKQLQRNCYEVILSNGEKIIADADHRWLTQTYDDRTNHNENVVNTEEIFNSLMHKDLPNHSIKMTKPLENKEKFFKVSPYDYATYFSQTMNQKKYSKYIDEKILIDINCEDYLFGSISQRRDFLNGFIDSETFEELDDGSMKLAHHDNLFVDLVSNILSSLGIVVTNKKKANIDDDLVYELFFNFNEDYNSRVYIVEVNKVDSVPVKCIQVDNEDHVYLAGNSMIPTHNTVFAIMSAVAAARSGKSVLFFSLEMGNAEIIDRIVACMSGVSMTKLKQGRLTEEEMGLVSKAQQEFKELKIIIDTDPKATVDSIRSKAFKAAQSPSGLDIIILDYLQLITPVGRYSSRQEAVSDMSRNMKLTAKALNVPIMVLVQLNRAKGDEEDDKMPTLDNIRESGAIAMDSDIVILLHRDVVQDDTTPQTIIILEKNRNGESKKAIRCHSNLECSLFREIKREKETSQRLTDEELEELEDDIDLSDFEDLDDDIDLEDL